MTNTARQEESLNAWPEKVFISAASDHEDIKSYTYPCSYFVSHEKCSSPDAANAEYIRADKASPLTQEEMRQVLDLLEGKI